MSNLVQLHPDDNVLVVCAAISAGEALAIGGDMVLAAKPIDVGHKLARVSLAPGVLVIKHGAPIGSTTAAIARGEHVHLHNMKSDYIPTHSREAVG